MSQGLIWRLLHWPEAGRDQSRQGGEGQDSGTRDLRASATICYLDRTSGERTPASVPITSLFGPQALYVSSCVDCPSLLKGHDLKCWGFSAGSPLEAEGCHEDLSWCREVRVAGPSLKSPWRPPTPCGG